MCSVSDEQRSYLDRYDARQIANVLGCETPTVYRKLNPNDLHAGLHVRELPQLCNGLNDYRLLHSIAAACGHSAFKLSIKDDCDLRAFVKEAGEALAAVSEAMADGSINTVAEAKTCITELLDLIEVATGLVKQCQNVLSDERQSRKVSVA